MGGNTKGSHRALREPKNRCQGVKKRKQNPAGRRQDAGGHVLTAPLLERSTRHQLQWLPVGSSSRDQTLCRTPLPSAGVWRPAPPRTPIPRPASAPLRWPPLCSRCLLNPKWKAALAPGGSSAGRVRALRWTVLERPSVPISGVSVGSGPGDTAVALAAPLCMTAPS